MGGGFPNRSSSEVGGLSATRLKETSAYMDFEIAQDASLIMAGPGAND